MTLDITDPQTGNVDIWAYESSGGIATRLTSHPAIDAGAVWADVGEVAAPPLAVVLDWASDLKE